MKQTTVQLDQKGRITVPKAILKQFRLRGGDALSVGVRGDAIELRPIQNAGRLQRVNGVLVFTGPGPIEPGQDLVSQSRDERIRAAQAGACGVI